MYLKQEMCWHFHRLIELDFESRTLKMTTARPPDRNQTIILIDYNTIPKSVEQFRGAVNDRSDQTELYQGISSLIDVQRKQRATIPFRESTLCLHQEDDTD